jgi:hypothetical protein
MPVFVRMRFVAIRLARSLRRSILTERQLWEIDVDAAGCPQLVAGPFRVVIGPRPVRLLDALHVYCGGAEIWLPIVWRLRLRNAVRLVLVENALDMFASADLAAANGPRRPARKRARQAQPA